MPITFEQIKTATNMYVRNLHTYNYELILKEMIKSFNLQEQVDIYKYKFIPRLDTARDIYDFIMSIYTSEEFDCFFNMAHEDYLDLCPGDVRYRLGLISMTMSDPTQSHFVSFVVDHEYNEVYVFDPMTTKYKGISDETTELNFLSEIYKESDYKVYGTNICSGCRTYQTDNHWYEQNIFCHTWSFWFLDKILFGISNNISLKDMFDNLNSNCKSEKENLKQIKRFAKKFAAEYLNYVTKPAFDYILNFDNGQIESIYEPVNKNEDMDEDIVIELD